MSETTSKLSLFKYNTTADAKQPFSIKDCMNDNWDKLDAFATSVDTIFSSSFSSNLDKKVFSDINKELGKKLEADVLLAENGYIKFNNGIIINYGTATGNTTIWRNFSLSFTNSNIKLIPWFISSTRTSYTLTDVFYPDVYTWETSRYKLITSATLPTHFYIAIGY